MVEGAKNSIKEAMEAFIDECEGMGTLEDVLEDSWHSRKPIEEENLATTL